MIELSLEKFFMRRLLTIFFLLSFFTNTNFAQVKFPDIDKSPMDISYYPNDYPLLRIQEKITDPLVARVVYSRPQKNGRIIFGELLEYGKVWRLGANEASEIEFYQNVKMNNIKIKKGRYTLYAIPYPEKWTVIINTETDIWGSFKYDIKKDIVRIDLPVEKQINIVEAFAMVFDKTQNGFTLSIAWDDIKISLPISL